MIREEMKKDYPQMPEEIRTMVQEEVFRRSAEPERHRKPVLKAVLGLAAAALLVTGAFAAVHTSDFFQKTYSRWEGNEEETINALVGAYVTELDQTLDLGAYTLMMEEYLVDANGVGVVTYGLKNPNGLPGMQVFENGTFDFVTQVDVPHVTTEKGTMDVVLLDEARSNDTEIHGAVYWVSVEKTAQQQELDFTMRLSPVTEEKEARFAQTVSFALPETEVLPAVMLTSEDGHQARLSPLSIRFDAPVPGFYEEDCGSMEEIVFRYADGRECAMTVGQIDGGIITGLNTGIDNSMYTGDEPIPGDFILAFRQLVDAGAVESMTVIYESGAWEFWPAD